MSKKIHKVLLGMLLVLFFIISFTTTIFAQGCTFGNWSSTSIDSWGQTRYKLSAPCVVAPNVPFDITVTVSDNTWVTDPTEVGGLWSLNDNGSLLDKGFFIFVVNGQWSYTKKYMLSGTPAEHTISFTYRDFGNGPSAMHWEPYVTLSGVTTVQAPNLPPIVDAGNNISLLSKDQFNTDPSPIIVVGTASDPEGDPLTYRWLDENGNVLKDWTPVDATGVTLDLSLIPPLLKGEHTFTLEVSDGTSTVSDTVVVTVENTAPVAAPTTTGVYGPSQPINLTGNVADYDGDLLTYTWYLGTTVLGGGQIQAEIGGGSVPLPVNITNDTPEKNILFSNSGDYTLTLVVSDGVQTVSADTTITIDAAAPLMNPAPSQSILWPPNGELTTVTITANATDNSGGPVLLNATVTSNQPSLPGSTDFSVTNIDQTTGVITTQLRAARAGNSKDRIYTVNVQATDQSGNTSKKDVTIKVPHDNGRN